MIQGAQMAQLPQKLKQDAIVEALFEVRFEHSETPELIVGKLGAAAPWTGYQTQRLPFADLPPLVRDSSPEMRYQPILQLVSTSANEVVKIGPRVLSLHATSPYPGWSHFRPRLEQTIAAVLEACPSASVERLGLRYINALSKIHGIESFWDLELEFTVGGKRPAQELMSSYQFDTASEMVVKVVIASPGFVQGSPPPGAIAYVDVDVFSNSALGTVQASDMLLWLDRAHEEEKAAFFSLWKPEVLATLVEA